MKGKAAAFLVGVAALPWDGWVLTKLWGWFIVPVTHWPQIGVGIAIGISATVSYLRFRVPYKDHEQDTAEAAVSCVLAPAIYLLLGYVVHLAAA